VARNINSSSQFRHEQEANSQGTENPGTGFRSGTGARRALSKTNVFANDSSGFRFAVNLDFCLSTEGKTLLAVAGNPD
jgi:hypothetical protein